MRCPYCKTAANPGAASCLRCGMTLEKVTRLFGVVPRIVEGISDEAHVLSDAGKRKIRSAANDLSLRFPQTNFSIVTVTLPPDTSLGVFAFWIFNEAGIARSVDRGANNHDILLTLDPENGRTSLMVGYALESFLSEQQLANIVAAGQTSFAQTHYATGIEKVIRNFISSLTIVAENLEQTHGIAPVVTAKTSLLEVSPNDF